MQTGQKFSTSMIAAVSNRGLMRFKLYKGALNVAIFIDFMKRLLKDAKQKVFLDLVARQPILNCLGVFNP